MPFMNMPPTLFLYFFFNVTATTEIYTLSLHDALPISTPPVSRAFAAIRFRCRPSTRPHRDRKSTRLNSSHLGISYAVLCLKKKNRRAFRVFHFKILHLDTPARRPGLQHGLHGDARDLLPAPLQHPSRFFFF